MELVKELPEIFEEFAEQRQRSFLVMKEVKDKGIPVVGAYCTYFPQEIAMAMNAFGIVKSFDVLEYQTICLPVIMYFKPVQPFPFDKRVK